MKWGIFFVLILSVLSAPSWAQDQPAADGATPAVNPVPANTADVVPPPEESQNANNNVDGSANEISIRTLPTTPVGSSTQVSEQSTQATTHVSDQPTSAPVTTAPATRVPPITIAPPRPVPTPPPFPNNIGNWSTNGTRSACLMLSGAIQIHLKRTNTTDLVVDVPDTAVHVIESGGCGSVTQFLELRWRSNDTTQGLADNTIRFTFNKQQDEKYALQQVAFRFEEVNGTRRNLSSEISGPLYPTTLKHSYRCISHQRAEGQNTNETLYLFTEDFQFEAFRDDGVEEQKLEFSIAEDCKDDHRISTGMLLAIAVAIGLLIVLCIAVAVYFIKRCRRQSGYQPLETRS